MSDGVLSNKARLGRMIELATAGVPPFVEAALKDHYGSNWRQHASFADGAARGGSLDLQAYLRLILNEWRDVFSRRLGHDARDAATALNAGRNAWAHAPTSGDVADDVTIRGLTGGAGLLEAIKAPAAKAARTLADEALAYFATKKSAGKTPAGTPAPAADAAAPARPTLTLQPAKAVPVEPEQGTLLALEPGRPVGNLEPWRLIAPPREDITSGRLTLDHFAADLATVDRGEAGGAYGDPEEFFRATHITGGLELVLKNGAARLSTGVGPSVIGLQTNFGGGKTHTMLALLHLARAADPARLAGVREVLGDNAGALKGARAVAFSGTDKGPDVPLIFAGPRPVRTVWGYLAFRIAGEAGLSLVAGAEEAGTNPGGEALEKVLRAAGGPVLVLLDEIVAYVRQLDVQRYEASLSFFQSLTEAASRVPQALIVGSLPQSEGEAGGERGRQTLERLEKLFGRLQSSWQAAQGTETYAIVRRRLFQELDEAGIKARDRTIEAYRKMYRDGRADFPAGVAEAAYAEMMREAYPVHPLLFDRLAQDWGSLDRFQRTRGVLKFVAEAARRLWLSRAGDPLIQPGSIPLADPAVRGTLTEALEGPGWGSIVDGEVESDRALPHQLDSEKRRFGDHAASVRSARAVFLGTAPLGEAKRMNGADLRFACAAPGENISLFGDAMSELAGRAGHLYTNGQAWWFGPQPTLRRLVLGRVQDIGDDAAIEAIIGVLKGEERTRGRFVRVHTCPPNPEEVEEASGVGLVVMHPKTPHEAKAGGSLALAEAEDALKRRSGGRLRQARNTLIFVAAEAGALAEAMKGAKLALAWEGVAKDKSLDLQESQRKDAETQAAQARQALETLVRRAWSRLIAPFPPREGDSEPFELQTAILRGAGAKPVPQAVWEKAAADGWVLEKLGKITLSDRLKAAWPAGAASVLLATVRDWFVQYPRFERLRDETVLADAIADLLADPFVDFAYARGVDEAGALVGPVLPGMRLTIGFDGGAVLATRAAAEAAAPKAPGPTSEPPGTPPSGGSRPRVQDGDGPGPRPPAPPSPPRLARRFYGSVDLDPTRTINNMQSIIDSVVGELLRAPGARISLRLEIEATAPEGFAADDAAVIRDNAASLRFRPEGTGFAEE